MMRRRTRREEEEEGTTTAEPHIIFHENIDGREDTMNVISSYLELQDLVRLR